MDRIDIRDRVESDFKFHPVKGDADLLAHEQVREFFGSTARNVLRLVPEGREQSIVLTKLEEAMFWANAGIARARPVEGA